MNSTYEILEDAHETTVYKGNEVIAVFFGTERCAQSKRFVDREEYLEQGHATVNEQ